MGLKIVSCNSLRNQEGFRFKWERMAVANQWKADIFGGQSSSGLPEDIGEGRPSPRPGCQDSSGEWSF